VTATAAPPAGLPAVLAGDDVDVPCVDGQARRHVGLDNAASTAAFASVADRVAAFMPTYSSVHRGAGYKSRTATAAYEAAREAALAFARRDDRDVAIICRNTTEALNHLAYRLRLEPDDVVATTVVEHHANLLPWSRLARMRYVECGPNGIFDVDDVCAVLDAEPRPRLLAVTGASNVTGWLPPIDAIIDAAHERGVAVVVDAAQLAPHRPIPVTADFVAWSGHKMYAPYGAGVLLGPRASFVEGDPFLAGGGAVELVDLDEVVWTDPPEREEAGSPNVVGAVALHAALDTLTAIGWDAIAAHEDHLATKLRAGLAAIDGVRVLGPPPGTPTLAVASFVVDAVPYQLVAARLSAEFGIATRHGCFCAHPYLMRLLDLSPDDIAAYRADVMRGDRTRLPGAVRASAGLGTSDADVDAFLAAVRTLAAGDLPPVPYDQDSVSGDFAPTTPGWWSPEHGAAGTGCARG
jgi:selenocysteine lyase/cysteine desulfurase